MIHSTACPTGVPSPRGVSVVPATDMAEEAVARGSSALGSSPSFALSSSFSAPPTGFSVAGRSSWETVRDKLHGHR